MLNLRAPADSVLATMAGHPMVKGMSDSRDPSGADVFAPLAGLEGVGSAVRAARDAVDVLLRDRGLRRIGPEVTAEALLRGAHASATLAGSPSTLDEVRRGAGDARATGAVRITAELMGLAPQV